MPNTKRQQEMPAWHQVEEQIRKEMMWLRTAVITFGKEEPAHFPITCKNCLLREIAICLISRQITAREITLQPPLKSFWLTKYADGILTHIYHGKQWHGNKMEEIADHFSRLGFTVEREPSLAYGRADLGIFRDKIKPLFIEVGTTSLFKLTVNLKSIKRAVFLLVPNDEKLIEFETY